MVSDSSGKTHDLHDHKGCSHGHDHKHDHKHDHSHSDQEGQICILQSDSAFQKKIMQGDKAFKKLALVVVICFIFMIVEVIGGKISGSLAILTDAAHMLSDVGGFLISMFSIKMG